LNRTVLLLDYSVDESETPLIRRWMPGGESVEVFAPLRQSGFPEPGRHRRVIHTGSSLSICGEAPFQVAAEDFIRRSIDLGVPQMGICYGHQLLIRAILGRQAIRRNPAGVEVGWATVHFSPDAARRIGVPRSCRIFQYHFDEVVSLPEGAMVAGWNGHTLIQAFIDESLRLFGVQFHPEFDRETGNRHFLKDAEAIAARGFKAEAIVEEGPEPPTDGRFFGFFLNSGWEGR
jgi:GMP synthase-like glutamine amidotransferase